MHCVRRGEQWWQDHRATHIVQPQPVGYSIYFHPNRIGRRGGRLATVSESFVPGLRYRSRAQHLWALVVESFHDWEERVNQAAAAAGLSPVSAWALVQLDPDSPISQKELAARLRCNPSTVVDPTDRLEDAGLVIRQPNPADRRVKVLVVTPRGRRVRDELIERLFEPPEAFRRLPAREQTRLRDVMLAAVTGVRPPAAARRPGPRRGSLK
jgi:DNA-binding MarR family transcriptional regulator